MKNLYFLFFVPLFWSCSKPRTDQIIVPKLEANFYTKALDRIDSELKSDPKNQKLVDQKLYYCDQLDWPVNCISALDVYKSQNGMTNQLVEQYITYYSRHGRFQPLVDIIERWSEEYDLKEKFHQPLIKALVKAGEKERAIIELRSYLVDKNAVEDFEFASTQFLSIGDTIMSSYYLGKLYTKDPTNELMIDYGQLLIELNYLDKGFEVLETFVDSKQSNKSFNVMLARLYAKRSQYDKAIRTIASHAKEDTLLYLVSNWYEQEQKWDSAIISVNHVIEKDSSNVKALWKKARLYEKRGWLATSLIHYNSILKVEPEDTITTNRIDLIQRKIAYLQRKKFEENKLQIREIEPIKINQ